MQVNRKILSSALKPGVPPTDGKSQLSSQVLYAPFVKASDKVRKDVGDMSFSDF